jgi:hypothetical protein
MPQPSSSFFYSTIRRHVTVWRYVRRFAAATLALPLLSYPVHGAVSPARLTVADAEINTIGSNRAELVLTIEPHEDVGGLIVETRSVPGHTQSFGSLITRHEQPMTASFGTLRQLTVVLTEEEQLRILGEGLYVYLVGVQNAERSLGYFLERSAEDQERLLYNPGPRYIAGRVRAQYQRQGRTKLECTPLTELTEADKVGNPAGRCPDGYRCDGSHISPAKNGACATYSVVTAGWRADQFDTIPGWNFERLSGGGGTPIVHRFATDAVATEDPCRIREVGIVFDRRAGSFHQRDSGLPYRLGHFKKLLVRFRAKLDSTEVQRSSCGRMPTSYITSDFRVEYAPQAEGGTSGSPEGALLGVLLYGNEGEDAYGNSSSDVSFWTRNEQRRLIHGSALPTGLLHSSSGLPALSDEYHTYEIDYKTLYEHYIVPPDGYSPGDAYVNGLDIYASVRGAALGFIVTDIELVGIR